MKVRGGGGGQAMMTSFFVQKGWGLSRDDGRWRAQGGGEGVKMEIQVHGYSQFPSMDNLPAVRAALKELYFTPP